ncbi:glucokinase [Paenibacillus sp. 4624]|uniref:ROK family protein n=1 Tax=Paenibacillus sp. 4624 TaxID=3156453 RepID=UPI003D1D9581
MTETVQGNAASQHTEHQSNKKHAQLEGFDTKGSWVAGVDIGGTKILMLLSHQNSGGEVHERRLPTQSAEQPELFFQWLFAELKTFSAEVGCDWDQLAGVGLGFPGVILQDEAVLRNAPAFQWPEEDIRPIIAKYYSGKIVLDNDVNMAAMGEVDQGAAKGHRHSVMVTVGTGIGAALVLNGELHSGQHGAAGEIGHFITGDEGLNSEYVADGDAFGVFEQVTSGTGITERARHYFKSGKGSELSLIWSLAGGEVEQIEARHVFRAAESGDVAALEILELPMRYMARGLANITALLNPSIIVLGGGVAASNPTYYLNEVQARLKRYVVLPVQVVIAELGNKAGAIGALASIRRHLERI